MKIEYMREFITIAKCLNFTLASSQLYIGQSTLSKHVALLEEELGIKLLIRTNRFVSLTDAGKFFLETCEQIVEQYDASLERLTILSGGLSGQLRVGILYYSIERFVSPLITEMRTQFPNIKVQFLPYQPFHLQRDLIEDLIDVALLYQTGEPFAPELAYQSVGWQRFVLVSPKDAPLAHRRKVSLSELDGQRLVLQSQTPRLRKIILDRLKQHNVHIKELILTEHVDTMPLDVVRHQAYSISTVGVSDLKRGSLAFADIPDPDMRVMMVYLYKKSNANKSIPHILKAMRDVFQDA